MDDLKIDSVAVFQSRYNSNANTDVNEFIASFRDDPWREVCDVKFQADQKTSGSYWSAMVLVCQRAEPKTDSQGFVPKNKK